MSKTYTASTRTLSPVPRSKRLRESGVTTIVNGAPQQTESQSIWIVQADGSVRLNPSYTGAWADGFISAGGQSDTEPSGGATTLAELQDVYLSSLANGQLLMYDSTLGKWKNVAQSSIVPDLSNYYTKSQTDSAISSAITALNLGAAATYGIGSVANGNGGLVTGGSVYSALAGYVPIATAATVTALHTFSAGINLNSGTNWSNSDRAVPFSASGTPANIRYYYDDADKGLTFNPYSGALKAASFVKRGGTSSQFLKADGSVDSSAYITGITSSMVTTALGYTPANTTALANYLPLAGGTMTGAITMPTGSSALSANGIDFGTTAHLGASSSFGIYSTGSIYLRPGNGTQSGSYGIVVSYDSLTYNSNTVYHAGNLTIATLLGSSAIGSASRPVYYTGSGFAGITSLDLLSQSTGYVKANRLYLNSSTYFEVDSNGYVHLVHPSGKGFYADGFVSAGGVSGSGTGGGIDALAMWKLLTNNNSLTTYDNNTKIASAHIPVATASAVGGIKVGSNLSISNGVLSATDTTYSAGTGLTLSGSIFSLDVSSAKTALGLGSNAYTSTAYLPLAGGTMTSTALISWGENFKTDWNASFDKGLQIFSSQVSGSNAPTQYATALSVIGQYGFQLALKGGNFSNFYIRSIASGQRTWYELLHTGNYNSFVPTLTGTGASGTWGISVTGSAASLSSGITLWGKSGINAGTSYDGDLTIANNSYLNYKNAAGTGNAGRIGATSNDYFRVEGASGISLRTGSTIATRMYIASTGNVGIGTTSPSYALDVVGSGFFSTGAVLANGSSAGLRAMNNAGDTEMTLMYVSTSDNLIIGSGAAVAGKATYINGNPIIFRYYNSSYTEVARMTTDGYFGIGTTTPAYALDVAGTGNFSTGVNVANNYGFRAFDNPSSGTAAVRTLMYLSSSNILQIGYGTAPQSYDTRVSGYNLELCYGTSRTTGATLTSTGDFQIANTLEFTNTSAISHIKFSRAGASYIMAPNSGSAMAFSVGTSTISRAASELYLSSGNVQVVNSLTIGNSTNARAQSLTWDESANAWKLTGNFYATGFISAGGASGTGLDLSAIDQDIIPDATRTRNLGSSSKMWSRTYTNYIDTTSSYALRICTAGTERMRFASSQPYVSIGNIATETGYSLVCAAKIKCTTLEQTSDARLKDILGTVDLSIPEIANAPAVYFQWKRDRTLGAGSIAQYWQSVLPWCVADSGGMLSMDYGQMALLSAIMIARQMQTLVGKVETHEQKIKRLEDTVAAQQEEINRLRAKMS